MHKKLDIIIPAYNAHNTIYRTLASILIQSNKDDINVLIVDDCSEKGYESFVDYYSQFYSISEMKMKENGGPGAARQFGIDHTSSPFFTCIDADDTFAGPFVLREVLSQLESDPKSCMISSVFIEEQELPDNKFKYLPHSQDMIWMFGKIYRRSFIDRFNIRFNSSRANEDNGFNTLIKLCSNPEALIKFSPEVSYNWHINPNSITRINNCEYSYNQSFPGYTDNMIYAIKEAKKRNPFNGYIMLFSIEVMCNLYEYYIETVARDKRFAEQNFDACRKFYHEIYKAVEPEITDEILSQVYNNIMRNTYAGNRMHGIIPCMGIKEFFVELKNKDKDYVSEALLEPLPKFE